jgi:hypothetical protein
LNRQTGFEAVGDGQQAFSEAFEGKFACFADFVVSAAAGVLHIGLTAQVLVGQLGHFGLQRGDFGLSRIHISRIGRRSGFEFFGAGCASQRGTGFGSLLFRHEEDQTVWVTDSHQAGGRRTLFKSTPPNGCED